MVNNESGLAIGDLPTWILAFVGLATLMAAIGAWRSSLKLLKVEQRRDEQGEQISSWAEPEVSKSFGGAYFDAGVTAIVKNPTKLPIYAVHICWERSVVPRPADRKHVRWEEFKTEARDLVPPDSSSKFALDVENFEEISGEIGSSSSMASESVTLDFAQTIANRIRVSLSFTDAMGQKWHRESSGKILKIDQRARWLPWRRE